MVMCEPMFISNNPAPEPERSEPYLTFSSPSTFSISKKLYMCPWEGTIEYSTDKDTWNTWGGEAITSALSDTEYVLYMRGSGNTVLSNGTAMYSKFIMTGSNVSCNGNIEVLLDWEEVENGTHPTMGSECFESLFSDCPLISAPELPAIALSYMCYCCLFCNTQITEAPELPATTLAESCYYGMFEGCTLLTEAPELPATTLAISCYEDMFKGCTSLVNLPELPATTLAGSCYNGMFRMCTSVTTAPILPAVTLIASCYYRMFMNCTSIVVPPQLPATNISYNCYQEMFSGCTALNTLPELEAEFMPRDCYYAMFKGCTSIKLSETQSDTYCYPYRLPTTGTGSMTSGAFNNMFVSTGGTFTGTPTINTTYYTDHEPI